MTPDDARQFKEILYLFLEKLRATKAAFYLLENAGAFRLVAQYGFTRTDRIPETVMRFDPLAVAVFEHREPRFVNDIRQAGRLAESMEATSSARILTAPLYLDGRIAGILDVRDKAGRESFAPDDLAFTQEVSRRLLAKMRTLPEFATASTEAESVFERTARFQAADWGRPSEPPGQNRVDTSQFSFEPNVLTFEREIHEQRVAQGPTPPGQATPLVELSLDHLPTTTERARRLVEERLASAPPAQSLALAHGPSVREAAFYRQLLETALLFPDVALASVASFDSLGTQIWLAAASPYSEEVEPALLESIEKAASAAGARFPLAHERVFHRLIGGAPSPLQRDDIAAIQSSVIAATPDEALVLTLVCREEGAASGPAQRESLKKFHGLAKTALLEIRSAGLYRSSYRGLVNKLLEPGLRPYSALKTHSMNVGRLARKLATFLKLPPGEVEQLTVAAILHDVGMRDLNYEELYGKRGITENEMKLLREHTRSGAFLAGEIPWPYEIPLLIRHHHEHWDGSGYPDGLKGSEIPFGSRVIQLCDAFDAMTSPTSYRSLLSASQALEVLAEDAGRHFDPELVPAFRQMAEAVKS